MRICGVGGPKGGVGKTTTAVHITAVAARSGLRTLLVDGDTNRSATDVAEAAGDLLPVDVAAGQDPHALRRLRRLTGYDLVVVDLPGAREGAFEAVLQGDGRPVVDLLVVPTPPETMDLRPMIRVVHQEVVPLGLPHLVVLTRVASASMRRARARQAQLREAGLVVADTIVREYAVYDEAVEHGGTVLDLVGRYARAAEEDYRGVAAEVFERLGLQLRRQGKAELA